MKNLLVVSYYFPPAAVVGTNRIRRFVKYLPDYEWRSFVITVDEKFYDLHDKSLEIATSNNLKVFRTSTIPFQYVHRKYKRTQEGGLRAVGLKYTETKSSFKKVLQSYLSIPDTRSGWIPIAVLECLRIMRQQQFDAVFTTSFPYSAHVIGLILKSIKNVFWVADFRDPWAEYAFLYPSTSLHKKTAYFLERKVVESADIILANTYKAGDRMRERYCSFARKIYELPNGYDQEEFEKAKQFASKRSDNKFVILHAGTIQSEKERRYPETLFCAISILIKKYPDIKKRLIVKFIGHLHFKVDLENLAKVLGIDSNILEIGYVEHLQAIQEMISADILLLLHHTHEDIERLQSTIPAKTYEYLAAKKPILCLSSKGIVGNMISEEELGISVDPLDTDKIVEAIESLYFNYESWALKVSSSSFSNQFEAKIQTEQLLKLLAEKEKGYGL